MGVKRVKTARGVSWAVDEWIGLPDGTQRRFRKRNIPTRELAQALVAKVRAEAFEGVWFERKREQVTVQQLWEAFEPICRQQNRSWRDHVGRAGRVLPYFGRRPALQLTADHVQAYRTARQGQTTRLGGPPSPATLDREVALLKRILSHGVQTRRLPFNPLAGVRLLNVPNTRTMAIDEQQFQQLYRCTDEWLRPILLVAFDCGMRKGEILGLRWSQVSLKDGSIRLEAADTKTEQPRLVPLSSRVIETLRSLPRDIQGGYVFRNPRTGRPRNNIRKAFVRAATAAGLGALRLHDLRRAFATKARRAGVPESVVMQITGHRTRIVFERYNVIDDQDLRRAIGQIERHRLGQDLDNVSNGTGAVSGSQSESR